MYGTCLMICRHHGHMVRLEKLGDSEYEVQFTTPHDGDKTWIACTPVQAVRQYECALTGIVDQLLFDLRHSMLEYGHYNSHEMCMSCHMALDAGIEYIDSGGRDIDHCRMVMDSVQNCNGGFCGVVAMREARA